MGSVSSALVEKVIAAQSAADTLSVGINLLHYTNVRTMVKTGAGVSAGSVVMEAAPEQNYAGTWVSVAGGNIAALGSADSIFLSTQLVNICLPYVRLRLGAITGGTVDAYILAN